MAEANGPERPGSVRLRCVNPKVTAFQCLAIDAAAVLGDDLLADGQTEAGSVPSLGGEKGFEYPGQVIRLDASGIVAVLQPYHFVLVMEPGPDGNALRGGFGLGERIPGVPEQIVDNRFLLGPIPLQEIFPVHFDADFYSAGS